MISPPDEDAGVCPECKSKETVSSKAKHSRVCLNCGHTEEFPDYAQALTGWLRVKQRVASGVAKDIARQIEKIDLHVTKIVIPTVHREEFGRWLAGRKIALVRPCKTDVWNGIESAYTEFELPVSYQEGGKLFDAWVADPEEA